MRFYTRSLNNLDLTVMGAAVAARRAIACISRAQVVSFNLSFERDEVDITFQPFYKQPHI